MPPEPHAQGARETLHTKLRASYARTAVVGSGLAKIVQRAGAETDLVAHYSATASVITALEDLKATAEQAAKDLRQALLLSFLDTGCPEVSDATHSVYLAKEPAFLEILDPAKIPPDLWTQPKPEPDRKLIKAALETGRNLGGAASITARNSQRLVIRPRAK
jgi:hypothetical protein